MKHQRTEGGIVTNREAWMPASQYRSKGQFGPSNIYEKRLEVMIHEFVGVETKLDQPMVCETCGKWAWILIHTQARHDLIARRMQLTLSAPVITEGIEMLSVVQQKKLKQNFATIIDRYAADDTYALYEGSGY